MKKILIAIFLLSSQVVMSNHSFKLNNRLLLDYMVYQTSFSKKEFDIEKNIKKNQQISMNQYIFNGMVKVDERVIKGINHSFKEQVVSAQSNFLVFSNKGKIFSLYFAVFNHKNKSYFFHIDSHKILSTEYNQEKFLKEFKKLNSNLKCIEKNILLCQKNNMGLVKYNKEIELMYNKYIPESDGNDVLTSLIYEERVLAKEIAKIEKEEKKLQNEKDNFYLMVKDQERMDDIVQIEQWKNELKTKYGISKKETKKKIKVAIIDSAFQRGEKDFPQVIKQGGEIDVFGHGTHVGGIILAVNSNIELYSYNVYQSENDRMVAHKIAISILDAIEKKVDIINISLNGEYSSFEEKQAFSKAQQAGIIIVVAAGNEKKSLNWKNCNSFPACYNRSFSNVIVVGNMDEDNQIAYTSNYGEVVDLFFYGTDIKSLSKNGGFVRKTGTSQATPFITGIISQYMGNSEYPLTVDDVKAIISKNMVSIPVPYKKTNMNILIPKIELDVMAENP